MSITNVEMEGKYFRERYCCANNIRSLSLSPLERYLRSKEWDEVTSLFYDVTKVSEHRSAFIRGPSISMSPSCK